MRGCGRRKAGGLYICSELNDHGLPLEHFLIDPPVPYEGERFRAPQIFEKDGKPHVLMWIGSEHYPIPPDYIEETRVKGASKRIPVGFPIEKLEPGSMMFLIHEKAIIESYRGFPLPEYCPKNDASHLANLEYCLGHTYQLGDEPERRVGDLTYIMHPAEIKTEELVFKAGIFLRMPITNIDHVLLKDGSADPRVAKKQNITKIPIQFVKE